MFKNTFKSTAVATVVGVMALSSSGINHAATLNVDVDINLPNIVILYAFTDIELEMNEATAGSILDDNAIDCGTTGDGVDCTGNTATLDAEKTGTITDLGTPVDLDITTDIDVPAPGDTVDVTIANSWGVRGLASGGATLDTSVTLNSGDVTAVDFDGPGNAISVPTFALQTGGVVLTIDQSDPDGGDGVIDANYDITVIFN